jgi:hypothetical protein
MEFISPEVYKDLFQARPGLQRSLNIVSKVSSNVDQVALKAHLAFLTKVIVAYEGFGATIIVLLQNLSG